MSCAKLIKGLLLAAILVSFLTMMGVAFYFKLTYFSPASQEGDAVEKNGTIPDNSTEPTKLDQLQAELKEYDQNRLLNYASMMVIFWIGGYLVASHGFAAAAVWHESGWGLAVICLGGCLDTIGWGLLSHLVTSLKIVYAVAAVKGLVSLLALIHFFAVHSQPKPGVMLATAPEYTYPL